MKKHLFKPQCENVNENCDDLDVAIDRVGFQSKHSRKKTTLRIFFVLFTGPVSPSGIYGIILLSALCKTLKVS